jgi:DNA adenine methylase
MDASDSNAQRDCQPFLRWAGSKRRLLPILRTFWTKSHKRYVEPFAGSACLFFALKPPKAILGDLNPELIATYLEVKHRIGAVLEELRKMPPADRNEYGRLRQTDPKTMTSVQRAARFIYLNRYCFNGIYRTNLKGLFNVPYSGFRCGGFPADVVFENCSRRLSKTRLMRGDFERVLEQAKAGDLVYMDPPFAVRERRVFREYDPSTFRSDDIKRLRGWMEKLHSKGISFVVSYAESAEANVLKDGFTYKTVEVRRNIAGFAAHRAMSNEIIISNS